MTLEKWVEFGWLKREPTGPDEIKSLLAIVDRGLKDSVVEAISDDLRFIAAFGAALNAATTALRACGYTGHHVKTIESLELTIGASTKLIQRLKTFGSKRNRASYDLSWSVSDQELSALIQLASDLRHDVAAWLRKSHPELLRS
jgi:hypothetical protein